MICTSKGKSVGLLLGLSYSHAPPTLLYSMLVYKTTGLLPHLACAQYTRYPPSQLARGKGVLALPLYLPSQFCLYLVERIHAAKRLTFLSFSCTKRLLPRLLILNQWRGNEFNPLHLVDLNDRTGSVQHSEAGSISSA